MPPRPITARQKGPLKPTRGAQIRGSRTERTAWPAGLSRMLPDEGLTLADGRLAPTRDGSRRATTTDMPTVIIVASPTSAPART